MDRYGDSLEYEIDLIDLYDMFWDRRKMILKIVGVFFIIGVLYGILRPVEYQTSAELLPEVKTDAGLGGVLQQYGGLLGVGGGTRPMQDGSIPPKLYPDIVESLPYLVELSSTEIYFAKYDTTASVHTFFNDLYGTTLFDILKGATINLPSYIINLPSLLTGLFTDDKPGKKDLILKKADQDSIVSVSPTQMSTVSELRSRVTVEYDDESGTVTLYAEMPDPNATAQLGHKGVTLLKEYLKSYRTEKAKKDLEFAEEQLIKAEERFEKAQNTLAEFRDSNMNLSTAKAQTRLQELQSQYDLAFNLYNSLSQQVEQAKLTVQEDTPVFSILQPITMPLGPSKPNWKLIFIGSLFLGFLTGSGWALVKGVSQKTREVFRH